MAPHRLLSSPSFGGDTRQVMWKRDYSHPIVRADASIANSVPIEVIPPERLAQSRSAPGRCVSLLAPRNHLMVYN